MSEERGIEEAKLLPHYVKLTKTTKGYTWEIKIRFEYLNEYIDVVDKIEDVDSLLRSKFETKNG